MIALRAIIIALCAIMILKNNYCANLFSLISIPSLQIRDNKEAKDKQQLLRVYYPFFYPFFAKCKARDNNSNHGFTIIAQKKKGYVSLARNHGKGKDTTYVTNFFK